MRRRSILEPLPALPSAEEVANRPELVKQMLKTASEHVNDMDIEHAVLIGLTPSGDTRLFHTYGRDLPMKDVASLLTDLATKARKQARK